MTSQELQDIRKQVRSRILENVGATDADLIMVDLWPYLKELLEETYDEGKEEGIFIGGKW